MILGFGISSAACDKASSNHRPLRDCVGFAVGGFERSQQQNASLQIRRVANAVGFEYRYDRAPLGALQGLAPDRVVYMGTVSKTLAPAIRLGWLVLPRRLRDRVVGQKALADHGSPTIDQLALARLIEGGDYDRHLRQARRRYRARRDALVRAVGTHLPAARVTGVAAGLHAIVRLGREIDAVGLMRAAAARSVGVYPLGFAYIEPRPSDDGLVLGYANLAEPAIEEGIRRLAAVLAEMPPLPAPTKDGGAMAR